VENYKIIAGLGSAGKKSCHAESRRRLAKVMSLSLVLSVMGLVTLAAQEMDGIISPNEYSHKAEFDKGNYILHWKTSANSIAFAMEAKTTGWLALGFEPTRVMKDADMVLGWVDGSGKAFIVDAWSTGTFGPHPEDSSLGGRNDITGFSGSEKNGNTIIEFSRPLASSDKYDHSLPSFGDVKIIWAYGTGDNINQKHRKAGTSVIKLGP